MRFPIPIEKSVLIPPNNSLTYEFDFININIAAIKMNLENKFFGLKSNEKTNNKTIATKSWINNRERKAFIHDLKMIDVGLVVSVRNANGDNNTKTFTNTYRIEYVITKFKIPKETKVLIIPSNEKISNASVFIDMIEFN